jgi:hypothetical protein
MREGGQRMPIPSVNVSKGIDYTLERETARYQWIVINVNMVVQIDEIVPKRLAKDQPGKCNQNEANKKRHQSK